MNKLIITLVDGKIVSVYAVAEKESDIEVKLEKGVDYQVCEY